MVNELIKMTPEQEKINYGAFVHEYMFTESLRKLERRVEIIEGRASIPTEPKATVEADGSIKVSFTAAPKAEAYVLHYGPVNEFEPRKAIFMGYTETTDWTLAVKDIPVPYMNGDVLYIWVQAFNEKGTGATDVEKAADLNDGTHWGSEWSVPTTAVIKVPEETV